MLIKKEVIETSEVCTFDSSMITKSIYTEELNELILFFTRGGYYSYLPVTKELYLQFVKCESQGKFFLSNIKPNKLIECVKIGNELPPKPIS